MSPLEERAAAHAAITADPEANARVAATIARIRTRRWYRLAAATRPQTERQAWHDFAAGEAALEREQEHHS